MPLSFSFSPSEVSLAQLVKNLPAMQEILVQFLGLEDPLEKGMATHSSILVWRIQWTEEPGKLQSTGSQGVRHDLVTKQQQQQISFNPLITSCKVVRIAILTVTHRV